MVASAIAQPGVPELTGRVVDLADLLRASTEAELTARLAAHEDSTSNQIAVLTIPSLNGEVLEPFATDVFRTWGLGQTDRDNGVLILIARDDRKIRIEVGFGLEGALPDATAGAIIRNEMTPRFRNGDFEGGTLAAVDAVIGSIEGEYTPTESTGGSPWWGALLFTLLFGAVPAFAAVANFSAGPIARYVILLFTAPFIGVALAMGAGELGLPVLPIVIGAIAIYVIGYIVLDVILSRQPWMKEKRKHYQKKQAAFRRARKAGRSSVVVDGISYSVPTASSSGGGFSGGGGSSGGGGASGGW